MTFEEEVLTQVHTQTATGTRIAIAVALAGAGMLAAAGIAGLSALDSRHGTPAAENNEVTALVQEAARVVDQEKNSFIIEGHATYTAETVKRIEFIAQIEGDLVQSGSRLTQFYNWPLLPEGHPGSTQMEEQFVTVTRANRQEITQANNPAGAELYVYGKDKRLNFTAGLPLLNFKGQRPPYDLPVRKQLAVNVDPRASITTFLHTAAMSSAGVVQLNPSEQKISTDKIRKGDVDALLSGVHGLSWKEFLPDVSKPYTAEIIFDTASNELRRIYITGSDVDLHLYFTSTTQTYLEPVNGYIDELPVINEQNYFLDDASYTGVPPEAMKNYSFFQLAYNVGEIDRWFYKKPEKKHRPPQAVDDPKGSSTDQPGENDRPGDSSTNDSGEPRDPDQPTATDSPDLPNAPSATTDPPPVSTETVNFLGVKTEGVELYGLWLK